MNLFLFLAVGACDTCFSAPWPSLDWSSQTPLPLYVLLIDLIWAFAMSTEKESLKDLRLLVQQVVRSFYEPKFIIVMDQLARNQA
jgi:hypothetical protein